MLARHKQLLSSLERVWDFLAANPLANPPLKFAERRAELDATVARLNALLGDQSAGQREAKDDTRRQLLTRSVLFEMHLAPISRIAKAVLPDEPKIQKALAMPPRNASTPKLIAIAAGIRSSAAGQEQLFVENGRPVDFLARLDAAIDAVRQTLIGRARNVGRHVGAKAGIAQELTRARRCVAMLDAMVLDAFAGNAEVVAKWKLAKRVQDVPGAGSGAPRATGGPADENLAPAPQAAA